MAIVFLQPQAHQVLPEYHVGTASQSCTYPGIAQCFAIAGWTQAGMLCTHVSPGATKADIEATFDYLLQEGGANVQRWYVVGPFTDHFAVAKARWRSVEDIKKTFKKAFGNKNAEHWILDVTTERNQFSWGIDIQAEHEGAMPAAWFSYRQAGKLTVAWTELKLHRFVRF